MINIDGIFKNRTLNEKRLSEYGFAKLNGKYTASYKILSGQFVINIIISELKNISVHVFDSQSNDEYVLVHTRESSGKFVGSVIEACEEQLRLIAKNCYDYEIFKNKQTKQIIEYVKNKYGDNPEYLWNKFPNNAICRRSDNKKWYIAILTVEKNKIGLPGNDKIEIIDLRETPENIQQLVDNKKFFSGYHMNKKYWYTVCTDGSISTKELCEKIDRSYLLAKK